MFVSSAYENEQNLKYINSAKINFHANNLGLQHAIFVT